MVVKIFPLITMLLENKKHGAERAQEVPAEYFFEPLHHAGADNLFRMWLVELYRHIMYNIDTLYHGVDPYSPEKIRRGF